MMTITQSGTSGSTYTITHEGDVFMVSNDPLYRFLRAAAELFIAGEMDLDELQHIDCRWSVTRTEDGRARTRENLDPAAAQMLNSIALAWMEPNCLCDPYRETRCECPEMDRRERLRELIGG